MATTAIPRQPAAAALTRPSRLRSLVRGRAEDPAWARPLLVALLALTALCYLIDLTASGYANSFYAAAVEAGTRSWKAFFFGSIDSSNFITVDKPPASLWVMELSSRVFGFSSGGMLVPQVLEGVASVALVAAAVRRWFGAGAGLLAGLALAVTPVAALMFRFNNPDALMVCLMVAAAYCLTRALERGGIRWLLAVGALLGFAFLAKMMEAFLVVPGFALVYLVAAPVSVRARAKGLLLGGLALLVSSGWWVAIVALWPASSRPMIDGSPDNSILNLIFDYNGFGRLSGGTGGANFSGAAGLFRLFNDLMGAQASWLLPAALIVLIGGLAWRWRAPRTDRLRAALMLWGSWLLVSGAVFSFGSGVIHTYYTVELAPAIAALVAIGGAVLWQRRAQAQARLGMVLLVSVTAVWAVVLLQRTPSWEPWLTPLVVVAAL
ncbi:MAG TPA: glycosyltransferase family 39 protein, partial [Solirubrobacteraceae bacterium]|nr:glycosyltransferase family 39 protein [Solirubrobacteraceae bacterium]